MVYQLVNNGDVPDEDYFNNALMKQAVIVCTSGTRPSSPPTGMKIFETDTKLEKHYNGSAWVRTGGFDKETYGAQFEVENTALTGITATSPVAGSPALGFTFKAPPSGGVKITVGGYIQCVNDGEEIRLSFELRQGTTIGSGTLEVGASSFRGIVAGKSVNPGSPAVISACNVYAIKPATLLTPLADYNIRTVHYVSGGSGSVNYRSLMVEPWL